MWNFDKFENKEAIIDEFGRTVTYRDLSAFCGEMKNAVAKRCLVFALCENSIGSVAGYAAFINNGIVPVLLNAGMERDLLDNLLKAYCPTYLWVPKSLREDTADLEKNAKSDDDEENLASLLRRDFVFEKYDYVLIKTEYDTEYPLYEELCLLLTTSGSTGSPKFVRQSYENVLSNAESIVSYLELDDTERPITTLPMNYTYGLSIINSHFLVGATLLVTDKGLMQKEFWNFFRTEGATSFGGVPYTYEMLNKLRMFRMDLPSLRYMTQAGGKITPELHQKFAEYASSVGKKFIVMYGQCEATARMGYLPADKALEKCGSMGIAIPGGKFTLIDVDDKEITQPDTAGELVYEGTNVTLGYAESGADLIKGDERGGILRTGDVAKRDPDGFYYIVGRMKRFLKIYGNRVNLDEIDRLIKGRFEGIDVASAGVDDHMYIFIAEKSIEEAASACEDMAALVREYVAHTTKLNPSAFKVRIIDEIPKNDAGKTLYKELTKYYE